MKRITAIVLMISACSALANGDTPPASPVAAAKPAAKTEPQHVCRSAYRDKDYVKAMSICRQTPDDPEAQYYIGRMYEKGEGVPSDLMKARPWYEKSANAGYGKAQLRVSAAYAKGLAGVEKDDAKAVEWLTRAANNNEWRAQEYLAIAYEKGVLGLPKDPQKVSYWRGRAEATKQADELRKQNKRQNLNK
jgi:TPR repeat protein